MIRTQNASATSSVKSSSSVSSSCSSNPSTLQPAVPRQDNAPSDAPSSTSAGDSSPSTPMALLASPVHVLLASPAQSPEATAIMAPPTLPVGEATGAFAAA